jgi:uncharacterized protein
MSSCFSGSLFTGYPQQLAPLKAALQDPQQDAKTPIEALTTGLEEDDQLLYAQELGRSSQIQGDFKQSILYYQRAIAAYQAFDRQAIISATRSAETAGALLVNDKMLTYQGIPLERIMLHQYQALNFLMQRRVDKALVEVRRMHEQLKLEQKNVTDGVANDLDNGQVDQTIHKLEQSANIVSPSLNAYSYAFAGLIYELANQPNDAYIDYRKALRLQRKQSYLQSNLTRLAQQLKLPQRHRFIKKWGQPATQQPNQGRLVILVDRGFVVPKQEIFLPIFGQTRIHSVAMPTYASYQQGTQAPLNIKGSAKPIQIDALADINQLAIKSLAEAYPGIVVRQIARLVAKEQMSQASGNSNMNSVFQITNFLTEQADLRSWLTLPSQTAIGQQFIDKGQYNLHINGQIVPVLIKSQQTTVIWALMFNQHLQLHSVTI